MHAFTLREAVLLEAIVRYVRFRLTEDMPLDSPMPAVDFDEHVGETITPEGIGGERALQLFDEWLAAGCISTDHPRYLAFIPNAPSAAASMFDLVVSASSIYGGSWLEGAGAVWAENQALAWLAGCAGYPDTAEGVFVPGGTLGNLSALVTARHRARATAEPGDHRRWVLITGPGSHSSIEHVANVMDVDVIRCAAEPFTDRLRAEDVRAAIDALTPDQRCFAVVATCGHTNTGVMDELGPVADVAAEHGIWMHIDGAYGAALLASDTHRELCKGIERSDSFIVDPHKWLFTPFDCCALVYRDATWAREAHRQHASYLDALHGSTDPSDLAVHLSRRARGLPLWFSLATNGTRAYSEAIDASMALAGRVRERIDADERFELVIANLSVMVFRRVGWTAEQYSAWSDELLRSGTGFVTPTKFQGEMMLRLAFVNPTVTKDDIDAIFATL